MNRLAAPLLVVSCCWVAVASDILPPRPVDVAAIVRQLGSEHFSEREEATRRLSTLSVDDPPPELHAALNAANPEVRSRARRALAALKAHIVSERERAAIALLPREERFAKRGQIDLYVASTAVNKLKAQDERLWLPAFEVGITAMVKAELEPNRRPHGGPMYVKDFSTYRKVIHSKMIRTDTLITRRETDIYFNGAILAAGVAEPQSLEALIVSRGSVEARRGIRRSLVLATGNVVSGDELTNSVVICDGEILVKGNTRNCLLIARGIIAIGGTSDTCHMISGRTVSITKPPKPIPRVAEPVIQRELDSHRVDIEEHVVKPLGFITFFELSTVGIEGSARDNGVKVSSVEKGKPFDHAGVWVGDMITEVNGKKPDSAESLRRLLRDALAIGDATVKLQRGKKSVTVKVSLPE